MEPQIIIRNCHRRQFPFQKANVNSKAGFILSFVKWIHSDTKYKELITCQHTNEVEGDFESAQLT